MELFRSFSQFIAGIFKRFLIWAPALFLDPYDLWARLIRPMLPDGYKFDLPWSPDWAPILLIGLIGWAAFLTFHEMRLQIRHTPCPDMKLKDALVWIVGTHHLFGDDNPQRTADALNLLRQAARLGRINSWGKSDPLPALADTEPLSPIPPDFWVSNQISYLEFLRDMRGQTEKVKFNTEDERYTDVHFNRSEIRQQFKRPAIFRRVYFRLRDNVRRDEA